jgi:hypothetical protein
MGGFSDPPLGDAAHTEEFLQRHPQSALRPSLELFSSTAGFERNTESRKTAAAKSVTLWRGLSASKNLVVQAIATEIDSSDYLYLPITATRVTDISCRRPATGYRPAGLSATGPPGHRSQVTGHWLLRWPPAGVTHAPVHHRAQDRPQLLTPRRQPVFDPWGVIAVATRRDDAGLDQPPQSIRKDVGRNALRRAQELGKASLPSDQVANHEERPAVADEIQRARDGAS